jgi:hypothetical protein
LRLPRADAAKGPEDALGGEVEHLFPVGAQGVDQPARSARSDVPDGEEDARRVVGDPPTV